MCARFCIFCSTFPAQPTRQLQNWKAESEFSKSQLERLAASLELVERENVNEKRKLGKILANRACTMVLGGKMPGVVSGAAGIVERERIFLPRGGPGFTVRGKKLRELQLGDLLG